MTDATLIVNANEAVSAPVTPLREAEVETEGEHRTAAGPEVSDATKLDAPPTDRPALKRHAMVNGIYTQR